MLGLQGVSVSSRCEAVWDIGVMDSLGRNTLAEACAYVKGSPRLSEWYDSTAVKEEQDPVEGARAVGEIQEGTRGAERVLPCVFPAEESGLPKIERLPK